MTDLINDWQRFVLARGWKAHAYELGAVVGQPAAEVIRFRTTRACSRLRKGKRFAELFALRHGRPPRDDEWPAPRKAQHGGYEWQAPELALLASLVGRIGPKQISKILTKRLRDLTGDRRAARSRVAILIGMSRLGLQCADVVGGITVPKAGREVGSVHAIWKAIETKRLRAFQVGRLWVIPRESWEAFKASRVFPPAGYVRLNSLKEPLSIRSDKLSEFARMGYVPGAVQCNPYGSKANSSTQGTWYVSPKLAAKLVSDRRAARPMPWHGKPNPDNLRTTFKLWESRQHPAACRTCAQIWGRRGAPKSFEDYVNRYPPLPFGAKRHLTRAWSPGLRLSEVAAYCGQSVSHVARAVENGVLDSTRSGGCRYVSRTEATRWKWRHSARGDGSGSWISLDTARKRYLFTLIELRAFMAQRKLRTKRGTNGPMRGITYVSRNQCARLRERIGFTAGEAARRAGVSIARLRLLLKDLDWRGAQRIPLVTVQAAIKRIQSRWGYTVEEAAAKLGMTVEWIHERKLDGTIKVSRARWDRRRLYITENMLERLRRAKRKPAKRQRLNSDWLLQTAASMEAGVSPSTVIRWAEDGELKRRRSPLGWRYHRAAVRARARRYWKTVRFHRAVPPAWLQQRAANDDVLRVAA